MNKFNQGKIIIPFVKDLKVMFGSNQIDWENYGYEYKLINKKREVVIKIKKIK